MGSDRFTLILGNTSPKTTEPIRIEFFSATGSLLAGQSLSALNPLGRIEIGSAEIPAGTAAIATRGAPSISARIESTEAFPAVRRFQGTAHVIVSGIFDGLADREITLWNPASDSAAVAFSVLDREGSLVALGGVLLGPRELRTLTVQSVFPDADLSSALAVPLTSDHPVVGGEYTTKPSRVSAVHYAFSLTQTTPAGVPSDLETHIRQTIKDIINVTLEPPDDWGRLLTLQIMGQLNRKRQTNGTVDKAA
jgi:hypothetical protein